MPHNVMVGIDLGTCTTSLAIPKVRHSIDGSKRVTIEVIQNHQDGDNKTPSVVFFQDLKKQFVGKVAERKQLTNLKEVLYDAKRILGRNINEKEIQEY